MSHLSIRPNPNVDFVIRHEDADLLVVEKPAGVVTQPGMKHQRDSLLNGLFTNFGNALQNLGEDRSWGLLHRLDKDTSGLVLIALRTRAYDHLLDQFKKRLVQKRYWAIVQGSPKPAQGVIQKPIAEVVAARKRAVLSREGKPAITAYKVLQQGEKAALIEALPKTGRLHQIRIHMASLGNPVLGDDIYGETHGGHTVPRLCLHAAELSFIHPVTTHRLLVRSDWPRDLSKTAKSLGLKIPTF